MPHPITWLDGGPDALAQTLLLCCPAGRLLFIADLQLESAVSATLASVRAAGRTGRVIWVRGGEQAKGLAELSRVWSEAFEGPLDRSDTVVTVGGGVVSDLGGFAAATLMRGLPVVHVATTLMGMVDAALGGKTAIDLPAGKNLVGAFYQPRAVVQWGASLTTLPDAEFRSGFAEVVKCALIAGEGALEQLEHDAPRLLARDSEAVARAVALATSTKMSLVAQDPEERGERVLLNLGHTLGHALESATDYRAYLHGEAVAIGLVGALRFGVALELTEPALVERVTRLLERLNLPTVLPHLAPEIWSAGLLRDKKRIAESVRFVFCRAAGRCEARQIDYVRLDAWIRDTFSGKERVG